MGEPSGSSERPLAAGPASAEALSLAAGLAELTAAVAGQPGLVAEAGRLRGEAEELAGRDAAAYGELLRTGGAEAREQTIELPSRMAELAAEVAELAVDAVGRGRGASRWDAVAGALLAETTGRVAALLVEANAGAGDGRVSAARRAAERAGVAAARALVEARS